MCTGLCPTYATALDAAEKNRNGRWLSCSRRNPQNWYYVTQFLAHPVEPRVPTQIIFCVDPCKRCWDTAQKPPKCTDSHLTPIVTKISFPPFSARRGPPTPKRGEDTFGTRVRQHAKFGVNLPAGCREIVDKKNEQNSKSKTNTSPFALTNEWRVIIVDNVL